MSILTRDEFERLLCNTIKTAPRAAAPVDVYRDFFEGTLAAYDAALARIAELERLVTGLHCNAIEAMLPSIPTVPEMIGLESSRLFPEEK